MPAKLSPLNVLPSDLLKLWSNMFTLVITRFTNLSFQTDKFLPCYKHAQVLLFLKKVMALNGLSCGEVPLRTYRLMKKVGLDSSAPANYTPISNPLALLKILEKLVLSRLRIHLFISPNFSQYQSAYRNCHLTVLPDTVSV